MNRTNLLLRLARLEDSNKPGADKPDPELLKLKMSLIAIVARHVGNWAPDQALAAAWAAALGIAPQSLKHQLTISAGDLWRRTAAHLEALAGPAWWENTARLSELYAAIPAAMKARADLLSAISACENSKEKCDD